MKMRYAVRSQSSASRLATPCRLVVQRAMKARTAPQGFDRERKEPKPECQGDEPLCVLREAERRQHLTGRPAEGEPSGKEPEPHVPEGGGLVGHWHEAVARRVHVVEDARLEQQPAEEERHAPGYRRYEIGKHNLLQEWRPFEHEERAD